MARPVRVELTGAHLPEDLGRSRERLAQPFGVFAVDAAVLLFERDGESQDFPRLEVGKGFQAEGCERIFHPSLSCRLR